MIKKVWAVFLSPAGHTEKVVMTVATAAAEALGINSVNIYDWTLPEARQKRKRFTREDFVIVGTPTYAGRIPNKLMPYVRDNIKGEGTLGAAIVTYGNRSIDESLMELCLLMWGNGFSVIGAGGACAQHVFSKIMAAGRPDEADLNEAKAFGAELAARVMRYNEKTLDSSRVFSPDNTLGVPGHIPAAPYYTPLDKNGQPAKFLKAVPKLDLTKCNKCNICTHVCPMGNIKAEDIALIQGPCIKCQACVLKCPEDARYFDDPAMMSHIEMLEENFSAKRGENIWL